MNITKQALAILITGITIAASILIVGFIRRDTVWAIGLPTGALTVSRPFGGEALQALYCCNGIDFIIGPPNPGEYMFDYTHPPLTFLNYQVFDAHDQWMLGNAIPGGACVDVESDCEDSRQVDNGTMTLIGTSI